MIVDTHVHIGGESPIFQVYSLEEMLAETKAAGVDRLLQVVTRFKSDNRLSIEQAVQHPDSLIGVIVSLDLLSPDASRQLRELGEHPKVLGFRMIAGTQGTPKRLADFDMDALLGAAGETGIAFQV